MELSKSTVFDVVEGLANVARTSMPDETHAGAFLAGVHLAFRAMQATGDALTQEGITLVIEEIERRQDNAADNFRRDSN